MNWGALLSGGLGLASSLFGRKDRGTEAMDSLMGRWNQIIDEGMRIYSTTDLAAIDSASLEQYKKDVGNQTQEALGNYQSTLSSQGYKPDFYDTEVGRTRGRVAEAAAKDVATMGAQLAQTRPMRQKSLLPDPQSVAGGFNIAAYKDQFQSNLATQEFQALMQAAQAFAPMLKGGFRLKRTGASDASGRPLA